LSYHNSIVSQTS